MLPFLFSFFTIPFTFAHIAQHDLICRKCGHTITKHTEILRLPSPKTADFSYEMDVLGTNTTVNVFTNPSKETFHVLTTKTANLKFAGTASTDATWFPGKKWTICVCSRCGTHMGWYFEPQTSNHPHVTPPEGQSFVGIVMDYVVSSDYADSRVVIPK